MKKQKLILLILAVTGLTIFVSCNNKSVRSTRGCPSGYAPTPAGCAPNGNMTPINYVPPINGTYQYFSSKNDFMVPTDSLFPSSQYADFLKNALGVCDRCSNSSGGLLECQSWVNGFNMLMISVSPQATQKHQMAVYTTPALQNSGYSFAWQFPDLEDYFINVFTGAPAPSCNYGQYAPYWATDMSYDSHNGGNGFVLYVNQGPFYSPWNLYKFRLYVPTGKIGDSKFDYELQALDKNGHIIPIAQGTLNRCRTRNCGMN